MPSCVFCCLATPSLLTLFTGNPSLISGMLLGPKLANDSKFLEFNSRSSILQNHHTFFKVSSRSYMETLSAKKHHVLTVSKKTNCTFYEGNKLFLVNGSSSVLSPSYHQLHVTLLNPTSFLVCPLRSHYVSSFNRQNTAALPSIWVSKKYQLVLRETFCHV